LWKKNHNLNFAVECKALYGNALPVVEFPAILHNILPQGKVFNNSEEKWSKVE
jgi:hypothetical protein